MSRLEEIEIWVANFIGNEDTDFLSLQLDDYRYLIQQAEEKQKLEELVEELEKENHIYKLRKENAQELNEVVIKPLREQNQRYKQAHKLNVMDYEDTPMTINHLDAIELARVMAKRSYKALEDNSND